MVSNLYIFPFAFFFLGRLDVLIFNTVTPNNSSIADLIENLSDLGGDLNVFCKEMCGFRCKPLLAEFKSNLFKNEANNRPNQDLMACLETCPLLCKCDDQP